METQSKYESAVTFWSIPILPTRHGNASVFAYSAIQSSIPILPTRHGNIFFFSSFTPSGLITFRSYLRGMETHQPSQTHELLHTHSDPTYEAWKLKRFPEVSWTCHSDPTYEAWKPIIPPLVARFDCVFRSYLRGMETIKNSNELKISFEFRSYLRGMETYSFSASKQNYIFIPILPTRHGNKFF